MVVILHRRHLPRHIAVMTMIGGIIGSEIGITTGEITETVIVITEIIALGPDVGAEGVPMEGVVDVTN